MYNKYTKKTLIIDNSVLINIYCLYETINKKNIKRGSFTS